MSHTQAVMFDLDGTLIDTYQVILASMRYTMDRYSDVHYTDQQLMHFVGTPLWNQMLHFAGGPGNEAKADEMTAFYREHNDGIHDQYARQFEGVSQMMDQLLDRGVRVGVVTGKRHGMAVRGLSLFDLYRKVEFVIGSDDCVEHKPQPGPVLQGCDNLGLPPKVCMYVGDSPYDIMAANAAGCTSVAVSWGMFGLDELKEQNPCFVIDRPEELLALL